MKLEVRSNEIRTDEVRNPSRTSGFIRNQRKKRPTKNFYILFD